MNLNNAERQKLECPKCGFKRLIDANPETTSELFPMDDFPLGWVSDYIAKCPQCRKQIGIKKIA